MEHRIYNAELETELVVDETLCENTSIEVVDSTTGESYHHYLSPKELRSFIGVLLHVQAKKRKESAEFDNLSNKF